MFYMMTEKNVLVLNLMIQTYGLPVRVVVGKRAEEGIVEVKQRINGLSEEVQIDELEYYLQELFKNIK